MLPAGIVAPFVSSGPLNGYPHPQDLAYASPLGYNMSSQYTHTQHLPHAVKREDSFSSPQLNPLGLSVQTATPTNGTKSCCSPPVEEPQPKVDLGPSLMPTNGVSTGGSCCSNKKDSPVSGPNGLIYWMLPRSTISRICVDGRKLYWSLEILVI